MPTYTARLTERAKERLLYWEREVKLDNQRGLTDINKAAENFYRGLLNIILDAELINMNLIKMDYPAVDLAEKNGGLCVQVTSSEGRDKINHTLTKFFERDLQRVYSRLIVVIIGTKPKYNKTPFPTKDGFVLDRDADIWDTAKLLQQIEGLSGDKLKAVDEYLTRELGEAKRPALFLPIGETMGANGFVGREAELEKLAQTVGSVKPLVLSGLGGMGKTELARRFGSTYSAGRVFFAQFRGSFYDTVADSVAFGIPGMEEQRLDAAQRYTLAMEQLRLCGEQDLLIIDNADGGARFADLKDETYEALCGLPLRLLLTTRHEVPGAIEVTRLANDELHRIFENHRVCARREELEELIRAVDGHTMTVDLMARTMVGGWKPVTPRMLLDALQEQSLKEQPYEPVGTDYNREKRQDRIYDHLRIVFDVAGIPEEAKDVLRCAALLPEGGMEPELFGNALPEEARSALNGLLNHGWLQRKEGLVTIHPVVRLVCRTELEPTDGNCEEFLDGIRNQYDPKRYDHVKFRQMAELFEHASNTLEDKNGFWAGDAGYFWGEVAERQRALSCYLRSVEKCEQHQPDSKNLAAIYNNVGLTYGTLGDQQKALEYKLKALAILEQILPEDHPDLAVSYNNVGITYGDLGEYQKALEYKLKALEIQKRILPENHPDLARSCNNVGCTYGDLGENQKALDYQMKALAIWERILPENHPELAQSCNNVGVTYGDLGEYQKALEYKLKALAILERVLPEDHPDLALSYNNVGMTYSDLGDHQKALEYLLKALAIRERVLPENHPDLAQSFNNVGSAYYTQRKYEEALVHMRRAADIINRSTLPEYHPHRVDINKWADRFERKEKRWGWLARLFGK